MPAKNVLKLYLENGYYHIYNRGVEKRTIFQNEQDYRVFLHYLKLYLSPPQEQKGYSFIRKTKQRPLNNYYQEINLLTYCLMPNHFHLLLKQKSANTIQYFMRSLGTKYVQYFNKRYKRIGPLFQDTYKAVLVQTDEQLLHLSRYLHLNPGKETIPAKKGDLQRILLYSYSSYADYLGKRKTDWLNPEEILSFFKTAQKTSLKDILSYQSFVEDYTQSPEESLGALVLDDEM